MAKMNSSNKAAGKEYLKERRYSGERPTWEPAAQD
jgi:hypothetical protein